MESSIFNPSTYHFNYNAIIPAFVVLVLFFIILYVFLKEKRGLVSNSFMLYLLSKTIWLSGMAIIYSTPNYLIAEAVFKYYVFLGVTLMPPTLYLYTSSVLNLPTKRRFFVIHYAIAMTFYIVNIKTNYIYQGMEEYSYGYYPIFTYFGSFSFLAYFYGNAFICFKNLIKKIKTINIIEEKNRIKDIVIGFLIGHISGIYYLPAIAIDIYPYGYIFVVIMTTYIFSAKPWVGIKDEALLKQKEGEEETFIFDDNIDKNFLKLMAERGN